METREQARLLAEFASEMQHHRDERLTIEAVVAKAIDLVPDAEFASITVSRRGRDYETLASSDDLALHADHHQYALEEGPCVETAETAEWKRSGSVGNDPRWPRWGPKAASLGIGSLLSVSLRISGRNVGALNMYATETDKFADQEQIDLGLLFAIHATLAMTTAHHVTGLETALVSRHMIGAAQGILMARYDLALQQSFEVLRRLSSHQNIKLAEVARQVVETGGLPSTEAASVDA